MDGKPSLDGLRGEKPFPKAACGRPFFYVLTELAQFLISLSRALIELAMLALAGQAVLGWLAGAKRAENLIWQVLRLIASPAVALVRRLMPPFILDCHIPWLTFALLLWLWLFLAWLKQ